MGYTASATAGVTAKYVPDETSGSAGTGNITCLGFGAGTVNPTPMPTLRSVAADDDSDDDDEATIKVEDFIAPGPIVAFLLGACIAACCVMFCCGGSKND